MPDPRVQKLAQVLVHYSLGLKPGQRLYVISTPLGAPLVREVVRESLQAGLLTDVHLRLEDDIELRLRHASEAQLKDISPLRRLPIETYDGLLHIMAPVNTRSLTGIDPQRNAIFGKAAGELSRIITDRFARGEMRWTVTLFPTQSAAQDAEMSLAEYEDFVFTAGMLDREDPVSLWQAEAERQRKLIGWFAGKKHVQLHGPDVDLRLSIEGRTFVECAGRENFPDGEIFTSPLEDSAEGWARFAYPAIFSGNEVTDVEIHFEAGKAVAEKASKGQEVLTSMLNMDEGSRRLGEWGIGTNYDIQRFTREMLFDEKIGGTIHLALGDGIPEAGGLNKSALHWDMLCDMRQGEIIVDGEAAYRNGRFILDL
jgi:aminopeptidase